MSDRDKKIILVLAIIAIVALPYVFVIKEKRIETETVKAQNVELQARLDYLRELDAQRDYFIAQTEANNKERDKIIASFPADIKQENYTMFLLQTEYSSAIVDEDGEILFEYPVAIPQVAYGENVVDVISDPESGTELPYRAITNSSVVTYETFYPGLKHYLEYFMNNKDPMAIPTISASIDSGTGIISGTFTLSQFAIGGDDRTLPNVDISPDLDDYDLRGNEELGIFGIPDRILSIKEEEEKEDNALENNVTEEVVQE